MHWEREPNNPSRQQKSRLPKPGDGRCCKGHGTNYLPSASIGKMVRSPGPVRAGFGLDDGEVLTHLAVVAFGYSVKDILTKVSVCVNLFEYLRDMLPFSDDLQ